MLEKHIWCVSFARAVSQIHTFQGVRECDNEPKDVVLDSVNEFKHVCGNRKNTYMYIMTRILFTPLPDAARSIVAKPFLSPRYVNIISLLGLEDSSLELKNANSFGSLNPCTFDVM